MGKVQSSDPNVITDEIIGASGQVSHIHSVKTNDGVERWYVDADGKLPDKVINPLLLGGTPFSKAQIEAAVAAVPDSGAIILIPAGTWTIDSAITLPATKSIIFMGQGEASVLYNSGSGATFSTQSGGAGLPYNRLVFENLMFLGQANAASALDFKSRQGVAVKQCTFQGFTTGKAITCSAITYYWTITDCYFEQCSYGIYSYTTLYDGGTMNASFITNCTFNHMVNYALWLSGFNAGVLSNIIVENVGDDVNKQDAIYITNTNGVRIENVYGEIFYGACIHLDGVNRSIITKLRCSSNGIKLTDSSMVMVSDCVTSVSNYALSLVGSTYCHVTRCGATYNAKNVFIVDASSSYNTFVQCWGPPENSGGAGLWWTVFEIAGDYNTFIACGVSECKKESWSISGNHNTFIGCWATNNNQSGSAAGGFRVSGTYNRFTGCVALDDQLTPTQLYGFCQVSGADHNIIESCRASGNTGADYYDNSGGSNTVRESVGYVEHNKGTATILNGETSVVITHGLEATPTNINVLGSTSDTAALFVGSIGATTFTILVASAVGGDRTIYWRAEI